MEFDKNKRDDPHRQNDAALLAALHDRFGVGWFKAAEVEAALNAARERRRLGSHAMPTHAQPTMPNAAMPSSQHTQEDAMLEAAEQVFGSRPVNAKSLGHWAKNLENSFVEGFVLRRQIDPHTKSNQLKVERP